MTTDTSEKAYQQTIIEYAKLRGWLCYHTYDSRRSAAGFPDLCLVRPPRVVFVEVKSAKGKLTEDQANWGAALRGCPGVSYFVWRPEDQETMEVVLQ